MTTQKITKKNEFHLTSYSKWDDLDQRMNQKLEDQFGPRFLTYRDNWKKTFSQTYVPDFPLQIGLETMDACNYKCGHCYRADNPNTKEHLDFETVQTILDEGEQNGLPCVVFGAGADEPFLQPRLMEMIEYCKKKNIMDIFLSTNGSRLTREIIDHLIELEIPRLQVSLDADTQGTYLKVRGGTLEPIEEMIRYCAEQKKKKNKIFPIIRLSYVVQDANRHECEPFLEKWKDIADKIDFQKYVDFNNLDDLKDISCSKLFCAEPWQRINVWANGDLTPCCTFYAKYFKLGSIHAHSIREVWETSQVTRLRKSLFGGDYHKVCINCTGNFSEDD